MPPDSPDTRGLGGLGDVAPKSSDPLEQFYDIQRQGSRMMRPPGVVSPGPSNVLDEFLHKLKCGTYFVKSPNWIEPPITARCLDLRTEACVTVTGAVSAAAQTYVILTFTVPDRCVGTLLAFGHAIDNSTQWGQVYWNICVNNFAIPCYQEFRQQIGTFVNPTYFPSPFRVKSLDVITVTARKSSLTNACVYARLLGFFYPARIVSQDGSFQEYHTI